MSTLERRSGVQFETNLLNHAERELAAFARAVGELFGAEYVRQSVEDWIEELELFEWPLGNAAPDWRQVTVAAAARVASRTRIQS